MYFAPASFCHQTILLRDSKNWFRNPNTVSGENLLRRTQLMMAAHRHHAWVQSLPRVPYEPWILQIPAEILARKRDWHCFTRWASCHVPAPPHLPMWRIILGTIPSFGKRSWNFCPVRSFSSTLSLIYQNMLWLKKAINNVSPLSTQEDRS